MELEDIKMGIGTYYFDRKSGRRCYILNCNVDDGAQLIIELFDGRDFDLTNKIVTTEACFLTPWDEHMEFVREQRAFRQAVKHSANIIPFNGER